MGTAPQLDRLLGQFRALAQTTGLVRRWLRWFVAGGLAISGLLLPVGQASSVGTVPGPTTVSRYETRTDPSVLYEQGASDAAADLSGATILDFGRPAVDGAGQPATEDFGGNFDDLSSIATAVRSYIQGYLANAPAGLAMLVLIGTNDSCGTGQPCGTTSMCGCANEPPDFLSWGEDWGTMVDQVQASMATVPKAQASVTVGAGDDAEPGYDPAFTNTYDVLAGYAEVSRQPMVDYGSLDGGPTTGYWSPAQMYDVVSGLRPDLPFPQIYGSWMPAQWAALSSWALTNTGHPLTFGGVLTQSPDGYNPQQAYDALRAALAADPKTAQPSIQWSSNIGPLS